MRVASAMLLISGGVQASQVTFPESCSDYQIKRNLMSALIMKSQNLTQVRRLR